jgi:hypothetical protein
MSFAEGAYVGRFIAQLKALAERFVLSEARGNAANWLRNSGVLPQPNAFEYAVKCDCARSANCVDHKP